MNPRGAVKAGAAPASMRKPAEECAIFEALLDSHLEIVQKERMKLPLLFIVSSALVAFSSTVQAQSSGISIRVEQANKVEGSKDPKDHFTKTIKHGLRVFVTNATHDEAAIKIKFTFFGHAIDSHDLITVNSGEQDATIKPSDTQPVETTPVTVTYTEDHYPPGKGAGVKTKIMGTGNKVTGYGVQVFLGDKLVAENYEPASLKEQSAKAPPVAAPPKK
jgi:hypothetical protein